jgi:hypothetical protein
MRVPKKLQGRNRNSFRSDITLLHIFGGAFDELSSSTSQNGRY